MAARTHLAWVAASLLAWPCLAQSEAGDAALGPEWVAVQPEELNELRGGFELPSGLTLSFGIERIVEVNGTLVATTRVNVADLARVTASEARALGEINQGLVVQVGAGNTFLPTGTAGVVVIQNTLDRQDIRTLTTLDVGVGTLGLFQDLNSQAALQAALVTAAGVP